MPLIRLAAAVMAVTAAALAATALPASSPAAVTPEAQRLMLFDRVWGTVNQAFYDPSFNGVDWTALRAEYRPLVASAADEAAAVEIIRRMLAELRVSHLDLERAAPPAAIVAPREPAVSWRQLEPGIGYLRIARFVGGQAERDRLDAAFAALDMARGLIIDLRGNPGGDLSLGMRLADHLHPAMRPIGLFATRAGLLKAGARTMDELDRAKVATYDGYDIDAFTAMLQRHGAVMLTSGGRAPRAAAPAVAVLLDGRTGSAAEGVAGSLKDGGAVIVGERSAGAMLSSASFPVGGWVLRVPVADHRTGAGQRLEGVGVAPTVAAPSAQALDRAVALLRAR